MSSEHLRKCSSPTDLCDGGVAFASAKVESEWIHATAGFSGGHQISVRRLTNESATKPLRQAIAELYRVESDAATRIKITPAYQIRQAIARKLNVNFETVVLIKGATEVVDSNPEETGPFQYILKTSMPSPFRREVRSRALLCKLTRKPYVPLRNGTLDLKVCANCSLQQLSMKKCAGCKTVYYCCIRCQRAHWASHRLYCNPDACLPLGTIGIRYEVNLHVDPQVARSANMDSSRALAEFAWRRAGRVASRSASNISVGSERSEHRGNLTGSRFLEA